MDYGLVKTLHILSATLLFGTGLGTAYFMWSANRSRDTRVVSVVAGHVVRADWMFTLPTIIFQPLSGFWLMNKAGLQWEHWIILSLGLYGIAGVCWLPVVWLQRRLRDLAMEADKHALALPDVYWRYARIWFWLGIPAFVSMVAVFFLMAIKPH